jgi:hypothetical protein
MNIISKTASAALFGIALAIPFASYADFVGASLGPIGFGIGASNTHYTHCRWIKGHYKHYRGHRYWVNARRVC